MPKPSLSAKVTLAVVVAATLLLAGLIVYLMVDRAFPTRGSAGPLQANSPDRNPPPAGLP